MKKALKEILIWIAVIIITASIIGYIRAPKDNINLSTLQNYTTLKGKRVSDILSKDRVIIIHFWGTWCPICKSEIDTIEKLSKRDDIILITVASSSGSDKELQEWLKSRNLDFIVINDRNSLLARELGVEVFPTTLYFSKTKKFKFSDSGYTSYMGFLARVKLLK